MFNEFIVIKDRATCTLSLIFVKASTASRSASKENRGPEWKTGAAIFTCCRAVL
jgi:hypothetical protein